MKKFLNSVRTQIWLRIIAATFFFVMGKGSDIFYLCLSAISLMFPSFKRHGLAAEGFAVELDTAGLDGDNLKFITDLQKRMKVKGGDKGLTKEEIEMEVRNALKPYEGIDMAKLKEMLGGDDKGIRSILLKQAEDIVSLQSKVNAEIKELNVRGQVGAYLEKNKAVIEQIRSGMQVNLPSFELRAPATMTNSTWNPTSTPFATRPGVEAGLIDLVERPQPTFWDRLSKGATKLNPYIWINKKNKQGAAAFIGEGVLKPLASFEIAAESSVPKKVAERMKISTELLYDIDGLTSFIEDELRYEVRVAENAAVLTGDGVGTNPKGATLYGVPYSLASVQTTQPNNYDAVVAAGTQLSLLNYINVTAYMNPADVTNMNLTKGTDGHYVLPPFSTPDGLTIDGIKVIKDYNIAPGMLLIGDFSKYRILIYQAFFIAWGWENDDFSKNLVTIIGEERFHQFMSGNYVNAIIYDSLANIKTAIEAA